MTHPAAGVPGGGEGKRPLEGMRVVVTRPRPQAAEITARLVEMGAEVIEAPAISIRPPDDPAPLEAALADLDSFDWVVFTSANGVGEVARRLESIGSGAAALCRCRVAAVGPGTRRALERVGVQVDLVPESYKVEALAEALVARGGIEGVRFLLPRADRANPVLPEVLEREGAIVSQVVAYRTVHEMEEAEAVRAALEAGEIDFITFTSASTVRGFVARIGIDAIRRGSPPARIATIGPETSRAARAEGLDVHLEADPHTIDSLLSLIHSPATK